MRTLLALGRAMTMPLSPVLALLTVRASRLLVMCRMPMLSEMTTLALLAVLRTLDVLLVMGELL